MPNKWDERYLQIAKDVAAWSKDPRRQIGAVIVGEIGQVVAQGYNGFPRGIDDSDERYQDRDTKRALVVHAEANAIYNALHNGASTKDCSIYVTGLPVCHECAKAIIQSGIKKVVMDTHPSFDPRWQDSAKLSLDMFTEAGVKFEFIGEING
jgi:dCMP deaminase